MANTSLSQQSPTMKTHKQTAEMDGTSPEDGACCRDSPGRREDSSEEDHKTRSEAITLIRARTLTRLSPTDSSPGDLVTQLREPTSPFNGQFAELKQTPFIMEPVHPSKKKNNRNGGGNQKPAAKKGDSSKKSANPHTTKDQSNEQSSGRVPLPQGSRDISASGKPHKVRESDTRNNEQTQSTSDRPKKQSSLKVDSVTGGKIPSDSEDDILTPASSVNPASITPNESSDIETESKFIQSQYVPAETVQTKGKSTSAGPQKDTRASKNISVQKSKSPASEVGSTTSSDKNRADSTLDVASSSESSTSQSSSKTVMPIREKLPSIQETSSGMAHGHSTNSVVQATPQSNITTETSPTHPGKGSGSHVPSSTSMQSTEKHQGGITTQKPDGFFWQLDSHGFPCAKPSCDKRCNLWDGATVICPRCGPYSEVRYCCKEHLFEEIKWHWLCCGEMTFTHPCLESSIPKHVRDGPPLLPCFHRYDTPERHRQAVYFNTNAREGDYFIFSDWADLVETGFPEDVMPLRCPSRIFYAVRFEDPVEKDRFRRVLAACLFMTIEVYDLVDYMYRLIRDNLRFQGTWSNEIDTALKYQLQLELAVSISREITGERHACETDWDGRSRRNCRDSVCRGEFFHYLGSLGGRGHARLLDHLEANHWMLRVARTTHPEVTQAAARMRGEGFKEVADEDRRSFCRGDGWDGAGSGEMEIEGINA